MSVLPVGFGSALGGYQIERSLRFNSADSAYLNRTLTTPTNNLKWTFSCWFKRSAFGSGNGYTFINAGGAAGGAAGEDYLSFIASTGSGMDGIVFAQSNASTTYLLTTPKYRDPSAWYHLVFIYDSANATSSNRALLYINGVQVIAFSSSTYPTSSLASKINSAVLHRIGCRTYAVDGLFDGYLTEVNFVDGQALTPSSFGETDSNTGVWKPKAYTGTYGTNGFYLKFADNSGTTSTTLGKDSSGNGNNWTPNNFSVTAGAGNDSLVDSPTSYGTDTGVGGEVRGNYATWNAVSGYAVTLTNGNLDYTTGTASNPVTSTWSLPTSGKWYWEVTVSSVAEAMIGIQTRNNLAYAGPKTAYYRTGGSSSSIYIEGSANAYNASSYTNGDVIAVGYDADNSQIRWYKNNVQQGGPYTLTSLDNLTPIIIQASGAGSNSGVANFGQRAFAYTAPSGFKALCTQNLPTPTIGATSTTQANDYFDATTYTGNGTSQSVVNAGGFQPDFVWVKDRTSALNHILANNVAGITNFLNSNTTSAESNTPGVITAVNSNGFSVGSIANVNTNTNAYVGWQWRANGAGSSNTAGTITSTVSANTTSGFSIVTYTGTGSASDTVGHGLGVTPAMVITKRRSSGSGAFNWMVKHSSLASNHNLLLESTSASTNVTTGFGSGGIANLSGSTTFGFLNGTSGNPNNSNTNTATYVAYVFAPVAGYSAFGSYTGNGSSDGSFVYTGFRPRWIMYKNSGATGSWGIVDTVRSPYNPDFPVINANLSNAEAAVATFLDVTANGFKFRTVGTDYNASSNTYIYAAFAEHPFKYSLAR